LGESGWRGPTGRAEWLVNTYKKKCKCRCYCNVIIIMIIAVDKIVELFQAPITSLEASMGYKTDEV